jgi:hypothetical protein
MAKCKNLQLERCTASKVAQKRGDERRKYRPERQSINERQHFNLSIKSEFARTTVDPDLLDDVREAVPPGVAGQH